MNTTLDVHGIGIINACGRGILPESDAEDRPEQPESGSGFRVDHVAAETLKDRVALKKLRRADRFSKMSALAAWDAAGNAASLPQPAGTHPGIVVATAFGPHRTTFEFLDEILDFGDGAVSPTKFSHSVHNAAAAYIAMMLDSRGPACTVTDFRQPLYACLLTAAVWLQEKRCTHVLAGYTEEMSAPMEYIFNTRHGAGALQAAQPFNLTPYRDAPASEGSLFLRLTLPGHGGTPLDINRFHGAERISGITPLARYLASVGQAGSSTPTHTQRETT